MDVPNADQDRARSDGDVVLLPGAEERREPARH